MEFNQYVLFAISLVAWALLYARMTRGHNDQKLAAQIHGIVYDTLRANLRGGSVTTENIGRIRRTLFMDKCSIWNSAVRDITAQWENKGPLP